MTAALEGGEWSAARPGRTLAPGNTRYPFYRRLGGPQGRSGRAENLVPNGIRYRTVQPVVSRYTDWATRPPSSNNHTVKCICSQLWLKTVKVPTNVTLSVVRVTSVAVEKAINITYSECVSIALVIQHAMRLGRIVICSLPGSKLFFYII